MRKVRRLLKENWIPIAVGILLTKWAVDYAYQVRGYDAIGSEWLVLPFTIFIFNWGKAVWEELRGEKVCVQYVEKIHVTADARTLKSRNLYVPANGARSQFMKVTSIWILQKAQFVKIA